MSQPTENPHFAAVAEDASMYALGLSEPRDRKNVEARLKANCPVCESEVSASSSVLADIAGTTRIAPVAPPAALRSRLMSYVAGERERGRDMRVVRGGEEGWGPGPVPGSSYKPLDGSRSFLIRLEAGVVLPQHDHDHAAEECLILEGSATAAGIRMQAGDFISMPQGSHHEDFAGGDEGCLLFISYK